MPPAEPLSSSNRDLWAALSKAENDHDTAPHRELLAEDVVVVLPGETELRGSDAYISMIRGMFRGLPDYEATVLHVAEVDDVVIVHWVITGTHDGELFGVAATGRRVTYRGCSVWRLRDGRIVEGYLYPDRTSLLAQLQAG